MRSKHSIASSLGSGFTLIELLVVISIMAILAGLLLPALTRAKAKAQGVQCVNNYRQLQLGWHLYLTDYNNNLPPNGQNPPRPPRSDLHFWWAQGLMDYNNDNLENTDIDLLVNPEFARLGDYSRSAAIYKCPSDRSKISALGRATPRVRSVSMNVYLGGLRNCFNENAEPFGPQRLSDIPAPAQTFVFLDEHPDSISFIHFWVEPDRGSAARITSYPGNYHNGSAGISFADGHVELHRWRDARTRLPVRHSRDPNWPPADQPSQNNQDIDWLQQRTVFPAD
jgi:prepilin-type N-terminal cleavage/methylation domain-containing protein/prepilin-type processing-associated H-X9-DG protein